MRKILMSKLKYDERCIYVLIEMCIHVSFLYDANEGIDIIIYICI
jgi:hypothetical protein